MPFNGTGTFVREFNWSNDAANNIPISASRFDGEDNDFASGLSLCLTRDGQGVPTQPLTWSQALTINVASDIAAVTGGRTGGVNNPSLQLKLTDAVGGQLNLTTAQTLGLSIQGTSVISMTSTAVNVTQALTAALGITLSGGDLTIPNGTALLPSLNFAASATTGFYSVGANELGLTIAAAQAFDFQVGQFAAIAGTGVAASIVAAGNASSLANGFVMQESAAGLARLLFGGNEIVNINASGQWSWDAPTAGGATAFTFTGRNGNNTALFKTGAGAGSAYGVVIQAGTNTSDYSLNVQSQGATQYLYLQGNGELFTIVPPAASSPPSGTFQVGYLDAPIVQISASTSALVTWRGKMLEITGGAGQTLTLPALASGMIFTIINLSGNSWTLSSATTLTWLPSGTTGNRTLANNGVCSLFQLGGSANWYLWGSGIT